MWICLDTSSIHAIQKSVQSWRGFFKKVFIREVRKQAVKQESSSLETVHQYLLLSYEWSLCQSYCSLLQLHKMASDIPKSFHLQCCTWQKLGKKLCLFCGFWMVLVTFSHMRTVVYSRRKVKETQNVGAHGKYHRTSFINTSRKIQQRIPTAIDLWLPTLGPHAIAKGA